jgi:hypothetical protein
MSAGKEHLDNLTSFLFILFLYIMRQNVRFFLVFFRRSATQETEVLEGAV